MNLDGLVGIYQSLEHDINLIKIMFKATRKSGSFEFNENEILDVKWITFDDFLLLPSNMVREEQFKTIIEDYRKRGTVSLDFINFN